MTHDVNIFKKKFFFWLAEKKTKMIVREWNSSVSLKEVITSGDAGNDKAAQNREKGRENQLEAVK